MPRVERCEKALSLSKILCFTRKVILYTQLIISCIHYESIRTPHKQQSRDLRLRSTRTHRFQHRKKFYEFTDTYGGIRRIFARWREELVVIRKYRTFDHDIAHSIENTLPAGSLLNPDAAVPIRSIRASRTIVYCPN